LKDDQGCGYIKYCSHLFKFIYTNC
jgi:hypothetical protein